MVEGHLTPTELAMEASEGEGKVRDSRGWFGWCCPGGVNLASKHNPTHAPYEVYVIQEERPDADAEDKS